jgi:hypothetical protein
VAQYSVGEKALKKEEVIKELLKLFKAAGDVNLEEGSHEGRKEGEGKETVEALEQEVAKYQQDNKVSYAAAYRVVAKKYADKLGAKHLTEQ